MTAELITNRNKDYTYVVELDTKDEGNEYCRVYIYAHTKGDRNSLETRKEVVYRVDRLPLWLRDGVAMLDIAGSGVDVPGLGTKSVNMHNKLQRYWFYSEQMYELLNEIAVAPTYR